MGTVAGREQFLQEQSRILQPWQLSPSWVQGNEDWH